MIKQACKGVIKLFHLWRCIFDGDFPSNNSQSDRTTITPVFMKIIALRHATYKRISVGAGETCKTPCFQAFDAGFIPKGKFHQSS